MSVVGNNVARARMRERIWYIISSIFVIIALLLAILLAGLRVIGFEIYTVTSGSMTPAYPVGSLVYVKSVDPATLKEGDVITFMNDETTVVTHRITKVISETAEVADLSTSSAANVLDDTSANKSPETLKFQTKGDANNSPDAKLVHNKNVLGLATFSIPLLGYVSHWLQRPPGLYVSLIIGTFLVALIVIPGVTKRKEERKK